MNQLDLEPLTIERVTLTLTGQGDDMVLNISGEIDMQDASENLRPFFTQLHDRLTSAGIAKITVDFRKLTYMNSSGIRELVNWILRLKASETQAYKLALRYNQAVTWQTSSIPVLQKLQPGLVEVDPQ